MGCSRRKALESDPILIPPILIPTWAAGPGERFGPLERPAQEPTRSPTPIQAPSVRYSSRSLPSGRSKRTGQEGVPERLDA